MNRAKLDFWVANNQNVLFVGKHGVGKTAIVKETFERHGLNYKYFSASTMDPWVDFIGVPKEKKLGCSSDSLNLVKDLANIDVGVAQEWVKSNWGLSEESSMKVIKSLLEAKDSSYLELIRPEIFASGEIEALFFDEFNRSPKKVRNAVMELIQFRSINGHAFPKLRLIWAAINPDDEEDNVYDVEKVDPAQKDRFHVIVSVPYKPNVDWFRNKYGKRLADSAIQWWDDLENKDEVSPRRLQYALDCYTNNGDIRDVLPLSSNVSKLSSALTVGPVLEKLEELFGSQNQVESSSFLSNENNFSSAIKYIVKSNAFCDFFIPLLSKEKISYLLSKDNETSKYIINGYHRFSIFKEVLDEVLKAETNKGLVKKIRKHITESQFVLGETKDANNIVKTSCNPNIDLKDWKSLLRSITDGTLNCKPSNCLNVLNAIPCSLSAKEVEICLSFLSKLELSPSDILSTYPNFVPTVNHLIQEGVKNTQPDGSSNPIALKEFQVKNISNLSAIYAVIKLAGLESSVIRSESQL